MLGFSRSGRAKQDKVIVGKLVIIHLMLLTHEGILLDDKDDNDAAIDAHDES